MSHCPSKAGAASNRNQHRPPVTAKATRKLSRQLCPLTAAEYPSMDSAFANSSASMLQPSLPFCLGCFNAASGPSCAVASRCCCCRCCLWPCVGRVNYNAAFRNRFCIPVAFLLLLLLLQSANPSSLNSFYTPRWPLAVASWPSLGAASKQRGGRGIAEQRRCH